jgi:hypothetical protein
MTTCKEYHSYEQYVWVIIQNQCFPKSLIPKLEYKRIKINIMLDYYHYIKKKYNCKSTESDIKTNELRLVMLYNDLKELNEKVLYQPSIRYIKSGLMSNIDSSVNSINRLLIPNNYNFDILYILMKFRQCSIIDPTGIPYYTVKQDIDIALYGLDTTDSHERKIGVENNLWVTDEYNTHKERNYYSYVSRNTDVFTYGGFGDRNYRIRIKPDYIKKLEHHYNLLCLCGIVHNNEYVCDYILTL